MLASGEKTVPGPMEHTIAAHPFVQAAVMFGRERNQVGVIVEPTAAHVFDPSDKAALTEYRNAIWGVVEDANRVAPTFSRIFKEMILVASPSKPLPRTAKGTVVRKAAIALYESEIDEV
jgi:long-subunit acyl-CoA synthetase (AMP-forming)